MMVLLSVIYWDVNRVDCLVSQKVATKAMLTALNLAALMVDC